MKVLVINAGSSSLKYRLYVMPEQKLLFKGVVEPIGAHEKIKNHAQAFELMKTTLLDSQSIEDFNEVALFGHRVVHGGEFFKEATLINEEVLQSIQACSKLAPLHNPANILGIENAQKLAPHAQHVAVFDTAFHTSMPKKSYLYALPYWLYTKHKIRRYGFHGSSHAFVSERFATLVNKPLHELNLIVLHLGNGASLCAIHKGKSIDTSMGFTPLEGLVMGSRSGDIDPAILGYLADHESMNFQEAMRMLNKESGLLGLCQTNDMRTILARMKRGDEEAHTAFKLYIKRIQKYLAAYMVELERVDGVIFTGGVGEHAAEVRQKVLEKFKNFAMQLSQEKNEQNSPTERPIHAPSSATQIWVIPTNEELYIAIKSFKKVHDDI